MSTTAAEPAAATPEPGRRPTRPAPNLLFQVLKPVASLQLTVALFGLSMVLVFFGTLAMMSQGLWTVVDDYFRSFVVWIPLDLVRKFGTVFVNHLIPMPKDASPWPGAVPFPAGWTIGFCMLVNLLAAHLVRFKLQWKRAGVIVLHFGVILLLVGELITGLWAVESTMTLNVGEASDFVDVTRQMEVAIVDRSDPAVDKVTVIPQHLLEKPGRVSDPQLPVDLEVLEYWQNTTFDFVDRGTPGADVFPIAPMVSAKLSHRPESAGVDTEASSDSPSVRVKLLEKGTGKELGTHLLSLWFYPNFGQNRRRFNLPEPSATTADGKTYSVMLRNKREYKPYAVKLLKFEHGKYPGTDIPKDFASTVTVTDRAGGDHRDDVRIWMNNPLRYAGDSLYQHAVVGADSGTVLQVVRNPGRLLPYLSCVLITVGMLIHFFIRLSTSKIAVPRAAGAAAEPLGLAAAVFPFAVLAVFALWVGMKAVPPKPVADKVDYYALGQLPVRDGGRVMPFETLARTSLQSLSARTVVENEAKEQTATATQWLAEVLDSPQWDKGPGTKHKVFRIEHDQLLGKLELPKRPGFYRYSLDELRPKLPTLIAESQAIEKKREAGKALDLYDAKVEELARKVNQYQRLAGAAQVAVVPPQGEGQDWAALRDVDKKVLQTEKAEKDFEAVEERVEKRLMDFVQPIVPKLQAMDPQERAQLIKEKRNELTHDELTAYVRTRRAEVSPAAAAFSAAVTAARDGDARRFDAALAEYRDKYLGHVPAGEMRSVGVEAYGLNYLYPFTYCAYLYLFGVVALALVGMLVWHVPLQRAAFYVALFTFVLHTAALITRMAVMGRPPVTNLYASAVFIGWGAVGLCLVLERIYKNGVGNVLAGATGAATMYLAQFLGASGDTMAMLQAVLDTNFWLATHVTTVTLGYTATFVAGGIATLYLLRGVLTPSLDPAAQKTLGSMMYGVLCFATLLSFVGTVLGGIWADYSWGRFWGWDPKENGAVLIVIWNALILHARWCGLVKVRGMAVLAVLGNAVTAWSWFGTNQLSIGLHAYGFDDRLAAGCFWYWVSQLAVAAVGLVPMQFWWSGAALWARKTLPVARPVSA